MQQPEFEQIPTGEWSAAAVAQNDPDLYAAATDVFMLLDPIAITDAVMTDREADVLRVVQALDDAFGETPYPYAEEDAPLPTDQWQAEALADEAEAFLRDGGEQ